LSVDADPLGEAAQVRRGVQARPLPRLPQHRRKEGAHGALAVRPRDVHRPEGALGVIEMGAGGLHALEAEVTPPPGEAVQPPNRLFVGGHVDAPVFGTRRLEGAGGTAPPARIERITLSFCFISARGTMVSTMPCSSRNSER